MFSLHSAPAIFRAPSAASPSRFRCRSPPFAHKTGDLDGEVFRSERNGLPLVAIGIGRDEVQPAGAAGNEKARGAIHVALVDEVVSPRLGEAVIGLEREQILGALEGVATKRASGRAV